MEEDRKAESQEMSSVVTSSSAVQIFDSPQ